MGALHCRVFRKRRPTKPKTEDLRWVFGLRNYENEDPSLFSYYENPKIFIYIVFAKILSVKVKSVAKWKIKFQYVFRGLLPLVRALPKNIAYQKSQKNREILPKVIKI